MTAQTKRTSSPNAPRPVARNDSGSNWPILLLLMLIVSAVFAPLLRNHFTTWDDNSTISQNPLLNPPTMTSFHYCLTHASGDLYIPVTYSNWIVIAAISGRQGNTLDPTLFHLDNILIHLLSSCLVFAILYRLLAKRWSAAAGAILFAIHPIQVEAVAWLSGTKDLLCGALSLAAIWFYLKISLPGKNPRPALHYTLATTAFILAMLSKPTAMVLPAIALALEWLLQRRTWKSVLITLLPWILLSVVCMTLTKHFQPVGKTDIFAPLWLRPLVAADALTFYLYKLLFPASLGFDYGRTPRWIYEQGWVFFTWIVPVTIACVLLWKRKSLQIPITGALIFLIGVSPVLGLIPFEFQAFSTVADHYLYLSMFGVAMVLAWMIAQWDSRRLALGLSIVGVLLAVLSFMQTTRWYDDQTLFQHTISINNRSTVAYINLAAIYNNQNTPELAIPLANRAVELNPQSHLANLTLGNAYLMTKQFELALLPLHKSVVLQPHSFESHLALGMALTGLGRYQDADVELSRAIQLNPRSQQANAFLVFVRQKRKL